MPPALWAGHNNTERYTHSRSLQMTKFKSQCQSLRVNLAKSVYFVLNAKCVPLLGHTLHLVTLLVTSHFRDIRLQEQYIIGNSNSN